MTEEQLRAMTTERIERRITYVYGVNGPQTRTGFDTHEALERRVELDTMGGVHVTKREQRTVTYGEWSGEPHE